MLTACAALFTVAGAAAQTAPSGQANQKPEFEVASVKRLPQDAGQPKRLVGAGRSDPGRVSYPGATLRSVLSRAYGVHPDQVFGPDWISTETYSIEAKVPAGATAGLVNLMLQNLLAERFKLTLHHEMRNIERYELSVASGGPKLQAPAAAAPAAAANPTPGDATGPVPTDKDGCPILPPGQHATVTTLGNVRCGSFRMASVSDLVESLRLFQGLDDKAGGPANVVDRTGIDGQFDFTLRFAKAPLPGAEGEASDPTGSPFLAAALEKQLGLKLVKKKGPLEVLVIDHADRVPTEN